MGHRLQRQLTSRDALTAGQFFVDIMRHDLTRSCIVYVACPTCGSVGALSDAHVIERGGKVVPAYRCGVERCSFYDFVECDGYGEPIQ